MPLSLPATASSSVSLSPSSTLLSLPTALLPHVLSFLTAKLLLASLTHTARCVCDLLTPACFSSHSIELRHRDLLLLSALTPSSSLTSSSINSHVLFDCRLSVDLTSSLANDISVWQLLDSLDHFTACSQLSIHGVGRRGMNEGELHALLHHPTTRACHHLTLDGCNATIRHTADLRPVDGAQPQGGVRSATKRLRHCKYNPKKRFDWADVRLPSLTHLRLQLTNVPRYKGMTAFLTAHTALVELDVNTLLVSVDELTALARDPAALPCLARLSLLRLDQYVLGERREDCNLSPLVTALAITEVEVSGRPRPVEWLNFDVSASNQVFAAAALMQQLTRLKVSEAQSGWINKWTEVEEGVSALPVLQQLVVHTNTGVMHVQAARTDYTPTHLQAFFQSMAERPLQIVSIRPGEAVTCHAAAIAQLARCRQLRQLELDFGCGVKGARWWMDWREAALFTSFTAGCFSSLRVVKLESVRLSAESVIAIASAAPQLRHFCVETAELSCHPAVTCAVFGGYCEHIEQLILNNTDTEYGHVWRGVRAADIVHAYQSAMAAVGRSSEFKPFTQLHRLQVKICWCTPPSVWHALLSMMRWATQLRCVKYVASDDPLLISSLCYLPSLTSLHSESRWPQSLANLMQQKSERTGRYRYVASHRLQCLRRGGYPADGADVHLTDGTTAGEATLQPIVLLPCSDLFNALQRSLSAEHRSAVARWGAGDFRAGDEQLSGGESGTGSDWREDAAVERLLRCSHPELLWQVCSEGKDSAEEQKADVQSDGRESRGSNESGKEEADSLLSGLQEWMELYYQ